MIALTRRQGANILMRLNGKREQHLDWRKGRKLNSYERIVSWKRPFRSAMPHLSEEEWEQLPEQMEVRLIKLKFENRYGQKDNLVVATTLLDHETYDGIELADLYARRWQIEVKLRDLKTTVSAQQNPSCIDGRD
jgi:IS4 transposase